MVSKDAAEKSLRVMVLGVGSFSQSVLRSLRNDGAEVYTYLTRGYAHYPPAVEGPTFLPEIHPNPNKLIRDHKIDFVIPMSIDWHDADWAAELIENRTPILSPFGEGMRLERERDFSRQICERNGICFPESYVAQNKLEARRILQEHPNPYVIKNPLCSPTSPVHTIVCETLEDTNSWLERLDYSEGVFLQEYLGTREAGHVAFVSGGEIYSLITNQEYKHAFNGNMGIIAGAPLGGLAEQDPDDKYNLAKELLHPLLPWFRETNFHGPVQVTACHRDGKWCVVEYNVRLGVTCAPFILGMLKNPLRTVYDVVRNRPLQLEFRDDRTFASSLTLAGYGYPFTQVSGPKLPVHVTAELTCDMWWNEVDIDKKGMLFMTGHRIADFIAFGKSVESALELAYQNIKKVRCLSSYYRTDIGQTKWPPGNP